MGGGEGGGQSRASMGKQSMSLRRTGKGDGGGRRGGRGRQMWKEAKLGEVLAKECWEKRWVRGGGW